MPGSQYSSLIESIPTLVPFEAPEALERRLGVRFHLRLGANESAFGPSPKAVEAMQRRVLSSAHYGDPQSIELCDALATRHRVTRSNIAVVSGIDELLVLLTRLFVNPGERVVTSLGTYVTFDYAAYGAGAEICRVPYRLDRPDAAGLAEKATEVQARLVYLANPDNPSGAFLSKSEIADLKSSLPSDCVLILDEAYADFVPIPRLAELEVSDPQVVRLRTFSKAYGMAGMRIGYLLGHENHVRALDKIRLHFGVNAVAQAGALAALADEEHLAWVVGEVSRQRTRLAEIAHRAGLGSLPSSTNFVAFDLKSRERAVKFLDDLLHQGVFVRKPNAPPLDRLVRFTVGTAPELDRLEEIIACLKC